MREVHTDTLDNFIENDSDDELGELINNYNYMIAKMSVLVDDQYKLGKAVKNAEPIFVATVHDLSIPPT